MVQYLKRLYYRGMMPKKDTSIDAKEVGYITKNLLKNFHYVAIVIILAISVPFVLPRIHFLLGKLGLPNDFNNYISITFYIFIGIISVESIRKMISSSLRDVLDENSLRGIVSFFRIVGYAVLLIIITSAQQGSVVFGATLGGFMGLLLGMASKELLGNAISGIFLIITKPFRIGEVINVAGGEGRVIDIRMMHTVVETDEQKVLIPNSKIMGNVIKIKRSKETQG